MFRWDQPGRPLWQSASCWCPVGPDERKRIFCKCEKRKMKIVRKIPKCVPGLRKTQAWFLPGRTWADGGVCRQGGRRPWQLRLSCTRIPPPGRQIYSWFSSKSISHRTSHYLIVCRKKVDPCEIGVDLPHRRLVNLPLPHQSSSQTTPGRPDNTQAQG